MIHQQCCQTIITTNPTDLCLHKVSTAVMILKTCKGPIQNHYQIHSVHIIDN